MKFIQSNYNHILTSRELIYILLQINLISIVWMFEAIITHNIHWIILFVTTIHAYIYWPIQVGWKNCLHDSLRTLFSEIIHIHDDRYTQLNSTATWVKIMIANSNFDKLWWIIIWWCIKNFDECSPDIQIIPLKEVWSASSVHRYKLIVRKKVLYSQSYHYTVQ